MKITKEKSKQIYNAVNKPLQDLAIAVYSGKLTSEQIHEALTEQIGAEILTGLVKALNIKVVAE